MSPESKDVEKVEKVAEEKAPEETPAFEGSLSDAPFMPAPDGHDVTKNVLEEKSE